MAKRILIECTPSYSTDMITGIQRVVRSIVEESYTLKFVEDYQLVPVIFFENQLYELPNSSIGERGAVLGIRKESFSLKLFKACSQSRLYLYIKDTVRTHLYSLFIRVREIVHRFVIKNRIGSRNLRHVEVEQGDILVLADVNWGRSIWHKVDEYRGRGAKVCLVLYDLIRVAHPEFCGTKSSEEYVDFLNTALNKVDAILSISNSVQQELKGYAANKFDSAKVIPNLDYFHLGVKPVEASSNIHVRESLENIFLSGESVYLIVSTIEPRKNHAYLLDAFDRLWAQGKAVKLLIVGRVGWMVDDLMSRIMTHPEYGKRLFVFHDLDDAELSYSYHYAKTLVFPSVTEGFGLPIIEALQNNLPVIASDIAVHREIAQEQVMYVNLDDNTDLISLVNQIEEQGIDKKYLPTDFSWMNWHQATKEFLQKVIKVSQ